MCRSANKGGLTPVAGSLVQFPSVHLQVFFRELPVPVLNGIPVEMVLATSTLEVFVRFSVVSRLLHVCFFPCQQCEHLLRVVSGKNREMLVRIHTRRLLFLLSCVFTCRSVQLWLLDLLSDVAMHEAQNRMPPKNLGTIPSFVLCDTCLYFAPVL